ncbi:MAG: hypothetical protein WCE81_06980 [Halobacteriota archaeon]
MVIKQISIIDVRRYDVWMLQRDNGTATYGLEEKIGRREPNDIEV